MKMLGSDYSINVVESSIADVWNLRSFAGDAAVKEEEAEGGDGLLIVPDQIFETTNLLIQKA